MNELYHHGVKGQKWGIRRYQNEDGTLTPAGKMRYREDGTKLSLDNMTDEEYDYAMERMKKEKAFKDMQRSLNESSNAEKKSNTESSGFGKEEVIKLGVTIAATAATVYLTEALSDEGIQDGKKLARKILLGAATTSIASLASSYGGTVNNKQNNNSNNSNNSNKSNKPVYSEDDLKKYNSFFTSDMSEEERNRIKKLKQQGLTVDEIEKEIKHSISNINEYYGVGWRIYR